MRRCILDGNTLDSLAAVHEALARDLGFPAHYGGNLDALWDVLTGDLPGPAEISWRNAAISRERFGEGFERLARVLREAAKERDDLRVTIDRRRPQSGGTRARKSRQP